MTQKGINTALAKPLALTAGIIGLLQGLTWAVFAVLAICCYTKSIIVDVNPSNYDTSYYQHMYGIFLNPDSNTNQQINPREFFIFMWFYVIFSIFWTLVSGTVIWAMIHNQWHLVKYVLGSWSIIAMIISIMDVVLLSLIAVDYKQKIDLQNNQLNTDLVVYGIMMTLVARGYLLWVINVIFACIMGLFVYQTVKNENNDIVGPIINGYDTANSNPPWFGGTDNTTDLIASSPKSNHHQPYQENHGFERSQSFFPASLPTERRENEYLNVYNSPYNAPVDNNRENVPQTNRENGPQTPFAASIAENVATIGRNKGRKSPLSKIVPTPVIPPPDYTPPGSPNGLRPVLRSTSKY